MWMVTPIGVPSSCMLRYILYVASFVRSSGCFLFSLLSVPIALMASTASRFECVAILSLYLPAYFFISSWTVGLSKVHSQVFPNFVVSHIPRVICYCSKDFCLFRFYFTYVALGCCPHNGIPYVQIGFSIVLYILTLFSRLSLDFRFISHCICLLIVCILFIIALICCFHVSCVSMWSPKYLTFPVCVMCVPVSSILADFCLRSVNVM